MLSGDVMSNRPCANILVWNVLSSLGVGSGTVGFWPCQGGGALIRVWRAMVVLMKLCEKICPYI